MNGPSFFFVNLGVVLTDFRFRISPLDARALRVKDLAYALKARGLARGDRVLTLLPNLPAHCDALQAIPAAQMIAVPINTRLSPADVEYIIAHSGARLLLVDSELVQLLPSSDVLSERGIQVVVCEDREGDGYDVLLNEGREFDRQNGSREWSGLEFVADENSTFAISCEQSILDSARWRNTGCRVLIVDTRPGRHERDDLASER